MTANPILVEVIRGTTVESFHRGSTCIADHTGRIVAAWGDVEQPVCPRSAIKLFQALPLLLESGAAAAFEVSDEDVALACASHSGEDDHVRRVSAWLARLTLGPDALECGAHPPSNTAAADALIRNGVRPGALHNNCSGKHTGFLTLARHLGVDPKNYTAPDHPVQRAVLAAVADMTALPGIPDIDRPTVRDGCSAPNIFLPLRALATGFARLGVTTGLASARAAVIRRIVTAVKAHPILMSGHGRPCAVLSDAIAGRGVVKTGAEGVFAAVLPEQGIGLAVKIDDGAGRAAVSAITALLRARRAFRPGSETAVMALEQPVQTAWAGAPTGVIRPAPAWLESLRQMAT